MKNFLCKRKLLDLIKLLEEFDNNRPKFYSETNPPMRLVVVKKTYIINLRWASRKNLLTLNIIS